MREKRDHQVVDVARSTICEVLETTHLEDGDDFFGIGGSSLSAAIIMSKLEERLGVELSLRLLVANPRIGSFLGILCEHVHSGAQLHGCEVNGERAGD